MKCCCPGEVSGMLDIQLELSRSYELQAYNACVLRYQYIDYVSSIVKVTKVMSTEK